MLTIFVNIQLFQELVWQGETLFYWCGKACVFWTVIQSNKLAAVMYCVKWHPDIVAYWPVEHQILTGLKVSTFSSHYNIIPFLLTSYIIIAFWFVATGFWIRLIRDQILRYYGSSGRPFEISREGMEISKANIFKETQEWEPNIYNGNTF